MRKFLKVLHTLASCGLIGGIACYMILLIFAPQETPANYADMRQAIAAIADYVLIPSMGVAIVSGLLSMAVHRPYQDKGWALLKLAMGILMFKGVLTVVGGKADYVAAVSRRVANGEPAADVLQQAIGHEWGALIVIMALSVANVILGIWRPKRLRPKWARSEERPQTRRPAGHDAVGESEHSLPAA
ncbi:hypothetical protein J2R99_003010 [Rhodopseudomonas julia]|uniref:DUF2269 family protein n=1 Tax=Rhodopseudomonas julia TaxID=200617 RepID=A0ABU0CB41_9BRAD|nr:DUF2269 family protein [Rhodopseudomonas julia]MDQ0327141.1 hypothetical protein [Rhodopseudomonas julia]